MTHCARCDDWITLRKLHRALLRVAPSLGAAVALAVIDGEIDGPPAGLNALDVIESAERSSPPGPRVHTCWRRPANPKRQRRPTVGRSISPPMSASSDT